MSNPLTTKTHEALWDERLDLDPPMAVLHEINVQHEINRICSVKTDPNVPRLAAMHVLKARYRAMVMVAGESMSTPAVNVVRYYESMGSEMLVSSGSMPPPESAARNVNLKNEQADDSEKSPVFEDSNEWPNTRDGVPRCFHHPHRPWAIYHPASACRELKEQQKLYGNVERRVQKQATRRAPSPWSSYNDDNNNNRIGYRNYSNTARDNYLLSDHRRPKHRDLAGGPGQDRRRQSRSVSPRSRRRYRFRLDHEIRAKAPTVFPCRTDCFYELVARCRWHFTRDKNRYSIVFYRKELELNEWNCRKEPNLYPWVARQNG